MARDSNYKIPNNIVDAVQIARTWALESDDYLAPYAITYIDHIGLNMEEAVQMGYTAEYGLKHQLLYVLSNLENWKGKEAIRVNSILGDFSK